ncbi:MAG TPA: bifunctional diaminohydroxyphosphoribosylaminopyrimidine deaminase/5-amino-6-(5-phosphoribosylamino)uracil reductase RibD [Acetobacteraceae bacterium]|nr:bifunctional diaminohydroxyphosphoribosylaminopyrimidine deaminase/5-amino-6-(5-phosphoribosylamino)uracil reductase RibD [Acetobacteraceae bacterium]
MEAAEAADPAHMQAALGLARRGLGVTWPNPSVGCVLVRAGRVVGRGATAPGGRPHAETVALAMAGEAARGATAYVTLEPCAHHGGTPPCADALIAAGVARVVAALRDPDPRVNGAGLARLRAAGIAVAEGLLAPEAEAVTAGFLSRVRAGRPAVTLKLAATLDGRIATHAGESRWITGKEARRAAHALRGRHDAVLVGIGTALADDPALTCRLAGYRARPPVRLVADSGLRLPLTAKLVATARETPTWVLHRAGADPIRAAALEGLGIRLFALPAASAGIDLAAALAALAQAGLTAILAEGGAGLAAGLVRADLVDRLAWFHAPALLGADGWPAAAALGLAGLAAMPRFRRLRSTSLGEDMLTEFSRIR